MLTISNTQLPPPSNWQDFEHLCWKLWKEIWGDPNAKKHGRQGQSQHGVDVYGQPNEKKYWAGIQCKGKDNFQNKVLTTKELSEEIKKAKLFSPKLKQLIFATTAPRDVEIQKFAREITEKHQKCGLFSVHIYCWDDIRDLLEEHHHLIEQLYQGAAITKEIQGTNNNATDLIKALDKRQCKLIKDEINASTQISIKAALIASGLGSSNPNAENPVLSDITQDQLVQIALILSGKKQKTNPSVNPKPAIVLSPDRSEILGLIAVSPLAFSQNAYKQLFPDINWDTHIRYFKRQKLIEFKNGGYQVTACAKKSFIRAEEQKLPFLEKWISILNPLSDHPDAALYLSSVLVMTGRLTESLTNLTEMAHALFPGYWNGIYFKCLLKYDKPSFLRKLDHDQRCQFYNAIGLCLLRSKEYEKSVTWFLRLRKYSKRVKNNWGIAQSYHNCGIAFIELDELPRARTCYRKSIKLVKDTSDQLLLGRSLYQLALTMLYTSPKEAADLLSQSQQIKEQEKDVAGFIGINHGFGVLALQDGEYQKAIQRFSKVEKLARKIGDYYAEAQARFNIGHAYYDLQKYDLALEHLRQARKMAEKDEFDDILVLAVGCEALALLKLGKYQLAEKEFRYTHKLQLKLGNNTKAVIALHDVGAVLFNWGKFIESRRVLKQASQLAHRFDVIQWEYQSLADIASCYIAEGKEAKAITSFQRMAADQANRKNNEVAVKLWLDLLQVLVQKNKYENKISETVERILEVIDEVPEAAFLKTQLYTHIYLWHWDRSEYSKGMTALEKVIVNAREAKDHEILSKALDQKGVCLQELNRPKEAIGAHRHALRLSRRIENSEGIEISLNNLGEALRKCRRFTDSIKCFEEAETIAHEREDHLSEISTAHNRGLALESQGEIDKSRLVFLKCRDLSRRKKLWDEYIRALFALANIDWNKGALHAEKQYAKTLHIAEKYNALNLRYLICYNYATALRERGEIGKAIKILESAILQFHCKPEANNYYIKLASLSEEAKDYKREKKYLLLALECSKNINSITDIAFCHDGIAVLHEDAGEFKLAEHHFLAALEYDVDIESRIGTLHGYLCVLLQMNKVKPAKQIFTELQDLAIQHKLFDEYIQSLLMIGEYSWFEKRSHLESLKSYATAMIIHSKFDVHHLVETGMTVVDHLCNIESKTPLKSIERLELDIHKWLKQNTTVDADEILWPFAIAKELILRHGHGAEISDHEFDEFANLIAEKTLGPSDALEQS